MPREDETNNLLKYRAVHKIMHLMIRIPTDGNKTTRIWYIKQVDKGQSMTTKRIQV